MNRIFSITLFLLALLPVMSQAIPAPSAMETKRVLILYSQDKRHPAHILTEEGITKELRDNRTFKVQIYTEYLDSGRFPGLAKAEADAEYLRRKYSDLKLDVIITVYPTAADFLLKVAPTLFPEVPIVAGEITHVYADNLDRSPVRRRVTGTILGENITGLLDSAIRLQPDTQRVALVGGASPLDDYAAEIILNGLKSFHRRFELIDLTKLPMPEIEKRVGALPPKTIVLYSTIFRDGAGQYFVPVEALSLVSRASSAPVFGLYNSYLGSGIVGGRLVSFELQGKSAADLALRIMAGAAPALLPFGGNEAYVDLYDWRELQRWHFPESAVPFESLRYHQLSFWEKYSWFIIGTISLAVIETTLILGLVINLKRRKQAERDRDESRMRLDLAADSAGIGLWSLDVNTGKIWATDRTLVMYGFAAGDEMDFGKFLAVVHPDDRDGLTQIVEDMVRDNKGASAEYRITLPDGNIRWMAARANTLKHPPGGTVLFGASTDITGRIKMKHDLQQKRYELMHVTRVATMGQLATTLAHELNQPLGAILRNAEAAELFLQDPSPDLDELRSILADIRYDDHRAGEVIDRIRSMMKQRPAERSPLDLDLLTKDVITLVQPDAARRRVKLILDIAPALPSVRGDRVQLQQILINLLLNAFEALDDNALNKRLVTVAARPVGKTVEVSVSDTGPGIAEAKIPQLFEPFFTTKAEGLGMGLAISRGIIEEHGGKVWAADNEAGGATFTFSLPVAGGPAA